MAASRKELLSRLLAVMAGVSRSLNSSQSSCVVLRGGRFYTMSTEVSCSIASGLDAAAEGAVDAKLFAEFLKALPDDDLEVASEGDCLRVAGGGRRSLRLAVNQEVTQPQLPPSEFPRDWLTLDARFARAVDVAHRVTRGKDDFAKECVHLHPDFVEASDGVRAVRSPVPSPVAAAVLVRGAAVKHMVQLGMTAGCATAGWLHFRNPLGLRMSFRKFNEDGYPNLAPFYALRGRRVAFPRGLAEVAARAGLAPDADGDVLVRVTRTRVEVAGVNEAAEYRETADAKYDGPEMAFAIPPKLLIELSEADAGCEVTPRSVRVDSGDYVYVAALEMRCTVPPADGPAASRRSTAASAATSTPARGVSIPARPK